VGTESDQVGLLNAVFLAYEQNGRESSFGLFRSKEGREFLRRLFRPYLRRQNFGEGKVASIIADTHPNPETQAREVDKTKSALRRWGRDGQVELWPKDEDKNIRHMRRLENEFLSVPELREIIEDTAETTQRHQVGIAFSFFFYGPLPPSQNDPEVEKLQSEFEGLYNIKELQLQTVTDPFERIKFDILKQISRTANYKNVANIDLDALGIDRADLFETYDSPSYKIRRDGEKYVRFSRVPSRNFMLVQSFELGKNQESELRARKLSTGFAFPLSDGTLHLLLTDAGPPSRRSYLALSPDELARPSDTRAEPEDRSWQVVQQPFSHAWESLMYANRPEYWVKVAPEHPEYGHLDVDKLSAQLDRTLWNYIS
jgi:hypothetical protein